MKILQAIPVLLVLFLYAQLASAEPPADPLRSSQWPQMHKLFLADGPVLFDDNVKVIAPIAAENALEVPVMIDASGINDVSKILVFADYNPIPKVLEYYPESAQAQIGFRFKIQQSSPIRAAVLDKQGFWHVNGVWIEAAGGGCTLPSVGSGNEDWISRLGEVKGKVWQKQDRQRLKFSVMHPMDTGLANGIPVFYLETIQIKDAAGHLIAQLLPFEPISENPVFTLDLNHQGPVNISGRDNNGNRFWADLTP